MKLLNTPQSTIHEWDFENPTHKKELIRIIGERDGYWCRLCGATQSLTIHHLRPRGQVPAKTLVIDEITGEVFYRDDPRNLCFLCMYADPTIHIKAKAQMISCHDWAHRYPEKATAMKYMIKPKFL